MAVNMVKTWAFFVRSFLFLLGKTRKKKCCRSVYVCIFLATRLLFHPFYQSCRQPTSFSVPRLIIKLLQRFNLGFRSPFPYFFFVVLLIDTCRFDSCVRGQPEFRSSTFLGSITFRVATYLWLTAMHFDIRRQEVIYNLTCVSMTPTLCSQLS